MKFVTLLVLRTLPTGVMGALVKLKLFAVIFTLFFILLPFQNCADGIKATSIPSSTPTPVSPNLDNSNILVNEDGDPILDPDGVPIPAVADCSREISADVVSKSCLTTYRGLEAQVPNFKKYVPQYPLYSDGSEKERWIYLPEGSQIDTSNPDDWKFPAGTILWKEFSMNGKKIETRVLRSYEDIDGNVSWLRRVYFWLDDQSEAEQVLEEAMAMDSKYAISSLLQNNQYVYVARNQCSLCHRLGQNDVAGFSYLQLSQTNNQPDAFDLESLISSNFLSLPPLGPDSIKGTPQDQQALGYLHSNCGTCHSPLGSASNFILEHSSTATSLENENGFLNSLNINNRVVPGDSGNSAIITRMEAGSMPTAGLANPDSDAISMLQRWIDGL